MVMMKKKKKTGFAGTGGKGKGGQPSSRRPVPNKAAPPVETKSEKPEKSASAPSSPRRRAGRTLVMLLGVLGIVYVGALVYQSPPSPGREISLDAVNRLAVCAGSRAALGDPQLALYCNGVDERIVEARLLDEDARIVGTLTNGSGRTERFWSAYPKSDAATRDLLANLYASGAEVSVQSQSFKALVRFVAQFLLPLIILADLFALFFMLIQSGSGTSEFLSFGRAGDRRQKGGKGTEHVTFANVAAAEEAVTELAEVRDYLADPSAFAKMGALPPKGVLLFGPPGCGKTLLAKAVAGEVKAFFFSMAGSEFVEALVGIGAARVRDLFAQARANAPAVIFIDELDAVGRQRGAGVGQGHDEREQTLNELLTQIDGFSASEGIVVMAATNRPDILDPALLRAGRFDRHVTVERPDVEGRLAILRLHAKRRRLDSPDSDLKEVAQATPGFSGADLANLLNEAALLAVRERASSITRAHLDEAAERVQHGPKRRGHVLSEAKKKKIAYHEAGHAVVAAAMGKAGAIRKLSVVARGRGMGHLAMLSEGETVVDRAEMQADITIAMAGFAAEELVFQDPSSGSEGDIERATSAARDMAGRFGMSVRLGPVRLLAAEREVFLGRDYLSTRDVSQPTLEHLDAEVRHILEEQKDAATAILTTNRAVLDTLASDLATHETLKGAQLDQHLGAVPAYVPKGVRGAGRTSNGGRKRAATTAATKEVR